MIQNMAFIEARRLMRIATKDREVYVDFLVELLYELLLDQEGG